MTELQEQNKKTGIVRSAYGALYGVLSLPGLDEHYLATLRGRLRLNEENRAMRNPVCVGDIAEFEPDPHQKEEAVIRSIEPRSNLLVRAGAHEMHPLGSNLSLAVLVMSLKMPGMKTGFIDRFLAACSKGGVKPFILFTKKDLLSDKKDSEIRQTAERYGKLGYDIRIVNLLDQKDAEELKSFFSELAGGTVLLAGNSGTGKSTLLNLLSGSPVQKTGEVSASSKKGRHTTTNPELFLAFNGLRLIDTPGIKEWGISHMTAEEVLESFPEFAGTTDSCRFKNCDHSEGSAGCAVQEVIESEKIHPARLQSLQTLMESLSSPDRVRKGDFVKPTGRMRDKIYFTVRRE